MSHYFAKDMFESVMLSPIVEDWKFEVYLVSDRTSRTLTPGGKVSIDVRKFDSFDVTYHTEVSIGKDFILMVGQERTCSSRRCREHRSPEGRTGV